MKNFLLIETSYLNMIFGCLVASVLILLFFVGPFWSLIIVHCKEGNWLLLRPVVSWLVLLCGLPSTRPRSLLNTTNFNVVKAVLCCLQAVFP